MKIGIIGVGYVGSTLCYSLICNKLVDEIYIYDINEKFLLAQKLDLEQGTPLLEHITKVKMTNLDEIKECDIVVNTASAKVLSPDRIMELKENRKIVKEIFKNFSDYKGIIINISNPCDIISYLIAEETKLPLNRIIGSGTLLDSVRLKLTISNYYNLDSKDVSALVIGEHGTSQVLVYSNCTYKNDSLSNYLKNNNLSFNKQALDDEVRKAGSNIFGVKNRTEYGIASCVTYIIKQIIEDKGTTLPLSTPYYFKNKLIYISKLARFNKNGYLDDVKMHLNKEEIDLFNKSCERIFEIMYEEE